MIHIAIPHMVYQERPTSINLFYLGLCFVRFECKCSSVKMPANSLPTLLGNAVSSRPEE
jgi:hypothetical protein